MEEPKQSPESRPISLAEISFEAIPEGQGPVPLPARDLDPALVAEHFAPLLPDPPSARERWLAKRAGTAFPGL